ncbi:restriction endonuclease subunit S [Pseudofrancisella aestuarii]|uniref:Restriction endonuclease subunit S n=1 Tax=Pseudofrancisella aestuarii TaxID=2670347 RepID=A0ABV9TBZ3_9GAMM|nr:restriction endonuclease subunit S [Pseudofrancisella aestuarii]
MKKNNSQLSTLNSQLNKPKLRFKEFSGEWEKSPLGHYFSFKNGINATKEQYGKGYKFINVLDIINNNIITHEKIIGSVGVSESIFNKNIVEYGDILFQRSSEVREEAGQSNVYLDKEKPATFGGFVIRGKAKRKYYPEFVHYMLKTNIARKEITTKSNGSTRYNVGQETLSEVNIYIPSISEQQKIASFLTSVDKKIELLTQKEKLLKEYKKGIMQKIFSQKIRFKADDSSEFPEWVEKKLGDYLIHKSDRNKNFGDSLVLSVSNKKGFITQGEQFDGYEVASKDLSNYKIVNKDDYAYNPSRINVGSIARLKNIDQGVVSPMYVVFKAKETLNNIFFDNLIQTHLFKHLVIVNCSGSVRDSLGFDDMCSFKIKLPCLEEQTKIASFLSAIDSKVEQVTKQLEHTKEFKKGLLQQMFV